MNIQKKILVFVVPILFIVVSIFTLGNYGVNWDEPFHYARGQAYFHYLLTKEKNYDKVIGKRSYFQKDSYDGFYFFKTDSAHPPANDILASLFNYIFFQKLNILGDIESYHLFIVLSSAIAVIVVSLFAKEVLGTFGAIIAGLSLSLYPLFFSESHFNIKDPVETGFFSLTIWAFWKSIKNGSWKWLFLSLVSFSLALGTKFNIVFLPFIILPYLFIRYFPIFRKKRNWISKIPLSYKILLFLSPLVILSIFIYLWPYLWSNPINNFIDAVKYYQDIGTGGVNSGKYIIYNIINLYPIYWIIITTPPWILLLSLFGIVSVFVKKFSKEKTEILWLLWIAVPVVRVSFANMSIYGGVRQIMEYIPAMALLASLGAKNLSIFISRYFKVNKNIIKAFILILFIPQIIIMFKIHPNENVYFNNLIGGLSGAKEKNVPYWGNSYGNAYWQAIKWINENSEKNAKIALVQGTGINIPTIQLRPDINFSNNNWSGIFRQGEYLLELTFDDQIDPYPSVWEYIDNLLNPVFEVKVDGVPIAKVWKNDLSHTKEEFKKPEVKIKYFDVIKKDNQITVSFNKVVVLTRFFLHYQPESVCNGISATIETSIDNTNWIKEKEGIPNVQVTVNNLPVNTSPFFFAARTLKYLKITMPDANSCLLNKTYFDFWSLE